MILFSLRCGQGHEFEEWFANGADYEARAAAHQIACPECADTDVGKAIMAPRIGKSKPAAEPPPCAQGGGCGGGSCAFADDF